MTTLEIILIAIVWIAYGIFNSYQHDWFKENQDNWLGILTVITFAPFVLMIRIIRGVFFWKGKYKF